jgi:DNA-binding LacI/PurR family transcriptional regulator
VRQAAEKLAYRPNAIARSLRHHVMHTIGFYNGYGYIGTRNPFLHAVLAGMHARCDNYLCDLLVHRVSLRDGKPDQAQEIIGGKVDGVVLWTYDGDPVVDMLAARHFPAVAIADRLPNVPSVTADDNGGGRLVAQRLAERGHKRILYRMPHVERMSGNVRCRGFLDEAKTLGLKVDVGVCADNEGKFSEQELSLLTAPDGVRPTAVACWNDLTALETYKEFQVRGWSDKYALIGFDGFEAPGLAVTITTVLVPWDDIAGTAVDMVQKIIGGQPVKPHVTVPVTLIEGDTD